MNLNITLTWRINPENRINSMQLKNNLHFNHNKLPLIKSSHITLECI